MLCGFGGIVKPYHTTDAITLYNAPALDVARSLPDGSVNLIIKGNYDTIL